MSLWLISCRLEEVAHRLSNAQLRQLVVNFADMWDHDDPFSARAIHRLAVDELKLRLSHLRYRRERRHRDFRRHHGRRASASRTLRYHMEVFYVFQAYRYYRACQHARAADQPSSVSAALELLEVKRKARQSDDCAVFAGGRSARTVGAD